MATFFGLPICDKKNSQKEKKGEKLPNSEKHPSGCQKPRGIAIVAKMQFLHTQKKKKFQQKKNGKREKVLINFLCQ